MSSLPILMYHNLTDDKEKGLNLTLCIDKFEAQLQYLVEHNFNTYFVSEIDKLTVLPKKSVVLTFDDVTENQLIFALPLLQKYMVKATFFIPFQYIGKHDSWNHTDQNVGEKLMTIAQLQSLDPLYVELGHHSYGHRKYSDLSLEQIQEDFDKSFECIANSKLNVFPALAYPYGNYPKKDPFQKEFFQLLEKNNIRMAFRIGNRLNAFPFKNKYTLQRVDIKGEDSLLVFKWKLRLGKLRLF